MRLLTNILIYLSIFYGFLAYGSCPIKSESLGLLEIHQSLENGQCLILISQIDPHGPTRPNLITKPRDHSKRRYTFRSDGYIELYEPEKVQEIQLLNKKADLSYSIINGSVVVQLPGGQKVSLGSNQTGNPGLIQTFTGFSAARETTTGIELTPRGDDSLLISPPAVKGYPHQKKGVYFDFLTGEGTKSKVLGTQVFEAGPELPVLKSQALAKLLEQKNTAPPSPALISQKLDSKTSSRTLVKKPEESIVEKSKTEHAVEKAPEKSKAEPTAEKKAERSVRLTSEKKSQTTEPGPVQTKEKTLPNHAKTATQETCSLNGLSIGELNSEYLKIQGEISLSRLAYFYLKDSGETTEKLETKIKALLKSQDLKTYQNILDKKVPLNAALGALKTQLLKSQAVWSTKETESYLLQETDFKFFSLAQSMEEQSQNKKGQIINFIRMIDSSYRNSANSKEEKFRKLESRFKDLTQRRDKIVTQLKNTQEKCAPEAQSACLDCLLNDQKSDQKENLKALKNIVSEGSQASSIEWGAFWLHTGRKGK